MQTNHSSDTITVKITPNDKGNPPGKLADAELHFGDGPLAGLKLIGFSIWERRGGNGRNVTFPARQYSVNGERRSFALLGRSSTRRRRTPCANASSTRTWSTKRRRRRSTPSVSRRATGRLGAPSLLFRQIGNAC